MPHNLYLHSGIVQTRAYGDTLPEKREALTFATIDSTVALMLRAADQRLDPDPCGRAFHKHGQTDVAELGEAHSLLAPLLGLAIAPTLFGIAPALLRPELDGDGDACRPDRHGRLPQDPAGALAAPADHPAIAIVPAPS
jgi:hypothetical protein